MGRRANPTVIGAFIIGAVALIVIGLLVLGRGQFFSDTQTFVLYFDGSIKGLNIGAPVDFQGVRIGSVTDIHVIYDSKTSDISNACVYSARGQSHPRSLRSGRVGQSGGNTLSL